ncbi:unnamed protein product, partial [Laminaria digitata]
EEQLNVLGEGVLLYTRLGLTFEGGNLGEGGSESCLRLIFRQISRKNPELPFMIAVNVDNDVYAVPECDPPLPAEQLETLLADLNR